MANPPAPYDAIKDNHTDLAREAIHPQHVSDALHGLALLGSLGLTSGSYVLSGHSAGACLAFQSVLQAPGHYGLGYLPEPPSPAALLGLNGLYDLPALATAEGLGAFHAHLRADYERLLSAAFGTDQDAGPAVSPASFDPADIAARIREGNAPRLVVLDQSTEDQPSVHPPSRRLSSRESCGLRADTTDARPTRRRASSQHAPPARPVRAVRGKPSGYTDRLTGTKPVRYTSVDPARRGSTARQGDTPWDKAETPRQRENSQLAGRFRSVR